jgi:hypothetical protein
MAGKIWQLLDMENFSTQSQINYVIITIYPGLICGRVTTMHDFILFCPAIAYLKIHTMKRENFH